MTKEELIKRLETTCLGLDPIDPLRLLVDDVIAALAQPEQDHIPDARKMVTEQEPVAWMRQDGQRVTTASDRHNYFDYETRYSIPLYTTPPQRGKEPVKYSDYEPDGVYHNKPQQEPVTYWKEHAQGLQRDYDSLLADFQAQRTWVGLTNDELTDLFYNTNLGQQSAVAQAIALLKEKNT